jgi:hypothetical protein
MDMPPRDRMNGFDLLSSTLDRFQEAHMWLHTMEDCYHSADRFRWCLNVFLKAINETPDLISMELQNQPGFSRWFKEHRIALKADPLINALSRGRNVVVHKKMLVPKSHAFIGITEGRGMKIGMGIPIDPLADSDEGMKRYLSVVKKGDDFLGILIPDEDSRPCVEREWRLGDFDDELVDLCSRAWLRVGEMLADVLKWLGEIVPPQTLQCRRSHQAVRYKIYSRETLEKWLGEMPTGVNG